MAHVLVISYDFPPCRAPGAAVRSEKFTRYLGEFGWRTTVLARKEPIDVGEPEPDSLIRVASPELTLSYQLTAWIWAAALWLRARRILAEGGFDLIYVSCPPFPPGLVAARLAASFALPLVVDFRDPWSLDPYEPRPLLKRWLKRALCRWVWPIAEHRIVESADCFIVTTPSAQRAYRAMFQDAAVEPVLLPNGFDEEDFAQPVAGASDARLPTGEQALELLYCGRFTGVADRSPEVLLRALRALDREGKRVRLRILGDASEALRCLVQQTGTQHIVATAPPVPHHEAVAALSDCDALLLYQEPSANALTSVAGKTYEYLRAGKPILAVAPPGDNVDLVERYAGRSVICHGRSQRELLDALRLLHADRESGELRRCVPPSQGYRESFNRRALTARLAELFDAAV